MLRQMAEEYPEAVIELIQEILNETKNNRKAAAHILGVSRQTFYTICNDLSVDLIPTRHVHRPSRAALIVMLNQHKGSRSATAKAYGVAPSTVGRWIEAYRLQVPAYDDPYWTDS